MLSCTILMYIGLLILNGMLIWLTNEIQVGELIILTSMMLMSLMFLKGSMSIFPQKHNP